MVEEHELSVIPAHAANRSGYAVLSAMVGGMVWSALVVSIPFGNERLDLYRVLLLFFVMVLVPVAFDLAATPDARGANIHLYRLARFLQPPAAIAAAAAFVLRPGITAAIMAGIWFLFTVLAALFGLWRLFKRPTFGAPRFNIEEIALSIALLFIPVGGMWLMLHRYPAAPLGFGGTIALLTAVHFHAAGFIALLIAACTGRQLRRHRSAWWGLYRITILGIIVGPPMVAVGITVLPVAEVIGASVLAVALAMHGLLLFDAAPTLRDRRARLLLKTAGVASIAAMMLALLYAVSTFAGNTMISIPRMAATHGILNAVFAITALAAWYIERPGPVSVAG